METRARRLELIRRENPDVLFNYANQTWTTDLCARFLDEPERPAMVLAPCGFSALGKPGWDGYFAKLRRLLPRYDALIFHSELYQDWDFAVEAGAELRHVIPNGADAMQREERGRDGRDGLLLTVGSHFRGKGHSDFVRALKVARRTGEVRGLIVAPPRLGLEVVRGCYLRCRASAAIPGNGLEVVDGRDRSTVGARSPPPTSFCSPQRWSARHW